MIKPGKKQKSKVDEIVELLLNPENKALLSYHKTMLMKNKAYVDDNFFIINEKLLKSLAKKHKNRLFMQHQQEAQKNLDTELSKFIAKHTIKKVTNLDKLSQIQDNVIYIQVEKKGNSYSLHYTMKINGEIKKFEYTNLTQDPTNPLNISLIQNTIKWHTPDLAPNEKKIVEHYDKLNNLLGALFSEDNSYNIDVQTTFSKSNFASSWFLGVESTDSSKAKATSVKITVDEISQYKVMHLDRGKKSSDLSDSEVVPNTIYVDNERQFKLRSQQHDVLSGTLPQNMSLSSDDDIKTSISGLGYTKRILDEDTLIYSNLLFNRNIAQEMLDTIQKEMLSDNSSMQLIQLGVNIKETEKITDHAAAIATFEQIKTQIATLAETMQSTIVKCHAAAGVMDRLQHWALHFQEKQNKILKKFSNTPQDPQYIAAQEAFNFAQKIIDTNTNVTKAIQTINQKEKEIKIELKKHTAVVEEKIKHHQELLKQENLKKNPTKIILNTPAEINRTNTTQTASPRVNKSKLKKLLQKFTKVMRTNNAISTKNSTPNLPWATEKTNAKKEENTTQPIENPNDKKIGKHRSKST